MSQSLRVMVLAGGPDRERPVSLESGAAVADALRHAGHEVLQRDILPDDTSALDDFTRWNGQVVFPVMHGSAIHEATAKLCLDAGFTPVVAQEATDAYSLLTLVVFVVLSPYFAYQAVRHKKYIASLRQRLGYLPVSFNVDGEESIWIHAVSVGEALTVRALISDLKRRYPAGCPRPSTARRTCSR